MKHTLPQKRCHEGVALLMVILIAALAFVGVVAALSFIRPRNAIVKGESASDRALSVADGTVDQLLSAVNRLGFAFGAFSAQGDTASAATTAVVNQVLADVNGGTPDKPRVIYVRTNGDMYTLGLPDGSFPGQLVTWPIAPGGEVLVDSLGLSHFAPAYVTNNEWFEVDTQVTYDADPDIRDSWEITATAYNISAPEIKRTVLAQARHGVVTTAAILVAALANGQWYTYSVSSTSTPHFFSDYAGMYGGDVYFGKYEVTRGPIFSSANLHMGGWAIDAVYSAGMVSADALDGGGDDGRFGPADNKGNAMTLSEAITAGLAKSGQAAPSWPKGDDALYGSSINKSASDTGMQDVCLPDYYINGGTTNTVVFSVQGTVGKVSINGGAMMDLPTNGIIYVDGGNVTVSGTLLGRCTVGAGPTSSSQNGIIYVGGNITYNTPPRNDPSLRLPANPDALGLVAYDSIVIPSSTYNANHTLRIDAAIMAVHGTFGIDGSASTHVVSSDPTQQYTGWWNGSQAAMSMVNAPCMVIDSTTVRGYEAQHTRFDWNLLVSAPPMYPATAASGTPVTVHEFLPVPLGSPVLAQLQSLTQSGVVALTPAQIDDHGQSMYYKYTNPSDGVTYYYGSKFGVSTVTGYTGTYDSAQLYRIAWREVIANPVAKP